MEGEDSKSGNVIIDAKRVFRFSLKNVAFIRNACLYVMKGERGSNHSGRKGRRGKRIKKRE